MCMYPSEIQRAPLTIYGRLNPNAHPTTSAPLETKLGSKTSRGRFSCLLPATANRTQLRLDRQSVLCSNILIYTNDLLITAGAMVRLQLHGLGSWMFRTLLEQWKLSTAWSRKGFLRRA